MAEKKEKLLFLAQDVNTKEKKGGILPGTCTCLNGNGEIAASALRPPRNDDQPIFVILRLDRRIQSRSRHCTILDAPIKSEHDGNTMFVFPPRDDIVIKRAHNKYMKRYLNVRPAGRWMVALAPLLLMTAVFSGWHSGISSAGMNTEVAPMDRQQPVHFETATFALG